MTIDIPPEWRSFTINKAAFANTLKHAASVDPRIARLREKTNASTIPDHFQLMFRHFKKGSYPPSGGVLIDPHRKPLELVVAENIKALSQPGMPIHRSTVDLPSGRWVEIDYSVESKTQHTLVDHRSFISIHRGKQVHISFAVAHYDAQGHREIAEIVDTFKFRG